MDENFNIHLGKKLRIRRLSLGLTQTKVAQAINVTFQQIQKYEKGTNGISSLRIMQLANFLKVPVVFFFEDFPLYQAVGHMDEGLKPWLSNLLKDGTMELNGMWNSIELAGMGLGVEWMVQSAMASMSILDLRNILALTSPVTRKMRDKMGWSIKDQFGDDGYFKYPNDKLLASIEHFIFPDDLPKSQKDVRVFLDELWADPTGYVMNIKGPKGKLKVRFNISV